MTQATLQRNPIPLKVLNEGVLMWAMDRELVDGEGRPLKATPEAQLSKTMEEIGEALLAQRKCQRLLVPEIAARFIKADVRLDVIIKHREHQWALEMGDILVTLCIGAAMRGFSLDNARYSAFGISTETRRPLQWRNIEYYAKVLEECCENNAGTLTAFGLVYQCVANGARVHLARPPSIA